MYRVVTVSFRPEQLLIFAHGCFLYEPSRQRISVPPVKKEGGGERKFGSYVRTFIKSPSIPFIPLTIP